MDIHEGINNATVWWLLAGVAVGLEMVSGTLYLLMLALGLAAGAGAAHLGLDLTWQLSAAAVVGSAAVLLWNRRRHAGGPRPSDAANPDLHQDVGATVLVEHWEADGTARVKYRGSLWTVMHRPGSALTHGPHRVVEVVGSRLLVEKI